MKRFLYILLSVCLLAVSFADASAQVDKREVRKGNRYFKNEEYTEAQMEYMKAVAKDTLSTAANYNLANSLFRQEDYANAAKALERVEATAVASPDGASVYYNQGAVAIAQQDWQKAVEAFAKSLLMNPDDLDAKENYIYAKKMLQNQQQNQQNQNQDQNQDQNDNQDNQDQNQDNKDDQQDQNDQDNENDQNQDQNDDRNNGDDQKDDQGQNDQNKDQQNQGQQPQISPQAAQQMLQAIQAKEKETQDKVNKAKAAALKSRQKEKNW